MKLGEFDDPSLVPWVGKARAAVPQGSWVNSDANGAVTQTPERLALAREAADKTIVLLKNSAGKLPLKVPATGAPKIAVMGMLACPAATVSGSATTCPGAANVFLGGYSATEAAAGQKNIVTGYDGHQEGGPGDQPERHRRLCGAASPGPARPPSTLTNVDPAAVAAAGGYDAVIVYVGTDSSTAAEDTDRAAITLPGAQSTLINAGRGRRTRTRSSTPRRSARSTSRAFEGNVSALLWSSYNGERKGEALADVLLGAYNPSGRTALDLWPRDVVAAAERDGLHASARPTTTPGPARTCTSPARRATRSATASATRRSITRTCSVDDDDAGRRRLGEGVRRRQEHERRRRDRCRRALRRPRRTPRRPRSARSSASRASPRSPWRRARRRPWT